MPDPRLAIARGVHTVIYVVMAAATFAVLYAGLTGARGAWLWWALSLVGVESVVFAGSGFKCPLTAVVARFNAASAPVSDTFFPERLTRYTLAVFGPLLIAGVSLLIARWAGALR